MQKTFYVLSEHADTDLEEIFDYTKNKYGLQQAVNYLLEIEEIFNLLPTNPRLGRKRDEIKEGLYSFAISEHVIFYRTLQEHIRIVRVLYGGRDLIKYFGE